jgi:F-box protein 9
MMKAKNNILRKTLDADDKEDILERSQPSSINQNGVISTTLSAAPITTNPKDLTSTTIATTNTTTEHEEEVWYDNEWELTWPIWHMLPREERRALAQKHGYKTIGEFEEYMSLQRAFGETEEYKLGSHNKPYDNALLYDHTPASLSSTQQNPDRKPQASSSTMLQTNNMDAEDVNSVHNNNEDQLLQDECAQNAAANKLPTSELLRRGGMILMLPEDMLHKVFAWLPVDTYATLALVSPHWKSFTRTESVYKRLCERLYLNQSKRRALHVSRFRNSYRTMLELRPRVRAMGGIYVMKCSRVRKIQRDMWTEVRTTKMIVHGHCCSFLVPSLIVKF